MSVGNFHHGANLPSWMRMTQRTQNAKGHALTMEHWVQMYPSSGPVSQHKQVYAALSLTDTPHNSDSDASLITFLRQELGLLETEQSRLDSVPLYAGKSNHKAILYLAQQSHNTCYDLSREHFVKVYNSGTPEFSPLETLMNRVDYQELYNDLYRGGSQSRNRGNVQFNFGFTGGENIVRTEETTNNDAGAAMPQINVGTEQYHWLLDLASKVARVVGIDYADPYFVDSNPDLKRRFDRFARVFGPAVCFEGFTIAFLEIMNGKSIKRHTDDLNDLDLTSTLVMNGFAINPTNGNTVRGSLIFYLRKCCAYSIVRSMACHEAKDSCLRYLESIPSYLAPGADFDEYYRKAGGNGLTIIQRNSDGAIINAALATPAAADKQVFYLSCCGHAIRQLQASRKLCQEELYEICLPFTYINSIFIYFTALRVIMSDPSLQPFADTGYVGLVIGTMIDLTGGTMTGGPHARSMVHCCRNLPCQRVSADLKALMRRCEDSRLVDHNESCEKYLRKSNAMNVAYFQQKLSNCGTFAAQSLSHLLNWVGLLYPLGSLHFAVSALGTNNFRRKPASTSRNPLVSRYLSAGKDARRRAEVVMISAAKHIRAHYQYPSVWLFTEAQYENIYCEAHRSRRVSDLFFLGQSFLRLDRVDGYGWCICQYTPTVTEGTITVVRAPCGSLSLGPSNAASLSCMWDQRYTPATPFIAIKRIPTKSDHGLKRKREAYSVTNIPMELIRSIPGLEHKIKKAFAHHPSIGVELLRECTIKQCPSKNRAGKVGIFADIPAKIPSPPVTQSRFGECIGKHCTGNEKTQEVATSVDMPTQVPSPEVIQSGLDLPNSSFPDYVSVSHGSIASQCFGTDEDLSIGSGFMTTNDADDVSQLLADLGEDSVSPANKKNKPPVEGPNQLLSELQYMTKASNPGEISADGVVRHVGLVGAGLFFQLRAYPNPHVAATFMTRQYYGIDAKHLAGQKSTSTVAPLRVKYLSGLVDDATNAVNKGRTQTMQMPFLRDAHISFKSVARGRIVARFRDNNKVFVADDAPSYHFVGRCELTDNIAVLLGGEKMRVDSLGGTSCWTFCGKPQARKHLLLCFLLTAGNKDYFHALHNRAFSKLGYYGKQVKKQEKGKINITAFVDETSSYLGKAPPATYVGRSVFFYIVSASKTQDFALAVVKDVPPKDLKSDDVWFFRVSQVSTTPPLAVVTHTLLRNKPKIG